MSRITLGLLACALIAVGAPQAHATSGSCKVIPAWCPAPVHDPRSPGTSTPEPGTLGLLALGAAASVGMLRRKKK